MRKRNLDPNQTRQTTDKGAVTILGTGTHSGKLKKDLAQKLEEARERWSTCSPYRSVRDGLIVSSRAQEVLAYRRG